MIITRTPLRISFCGGGSDFPQWYETNGGSCIGMAISKYCYISVRELPPYFTYRHRLVYSKIELANSTEEIEHPAVRAILADQCVEEGLEIHYDADIPSRSGMGSSSSFTVGLLQGLEALRGRIISKQRLASEAIRLEQQVMQEAVGSQDQIFASFGGLNRIDFDASGFRVRQIILPTPRLAELLDHLVLVFTGFQRFATEIERQKVERLADNAAYLRQLSNMVNEVEEILTNTTRELIVLGEIIDQAWALKKALAPEVSNPALDAIYDRAIAAGALGGKLLGAGNGGFFCFIVRPEQKPALRAALSDLIEVPIGVDHDGSRIMVYEPNGLSR